MHSISPGFTTLPSNCTHSPSGHITGLKAAARRDALTLGAGSPTPSRRRRQRGHYFLVNDILIPPLPSITSPPPPPLLREPRALCRPFSLPGSLHINPISKLPKPPSPQPTQLLLRPRPPTPRSQHPLPGCLPLSQDTLRPPDPHHSAAPCPTPNVFSAGLPGLEETHHSGGCYCHCSGC